MPTTICARLTTVHILSNAKKQYNPLGPAVIYKSNIKLLLYMTNVNTLIS